MIDIGFFEFFVFKELNLLFVEKFENSLIKMDLKIRFKREMVKIF